MDPGGDISGNYIELFWPSFVSATLIALVHLLTPRFHFMRKPDNLWLPASAGVALAYVFMEIFPHLAKSQEKLVHVAENSVYGFLTHNVYLVGLVGFSIYLGVSLLVMAYREDQATRISVRSATLLFEVEGASLAAYSFIIGYLLSEWVTHSPEPIIIFGLAMAIHFAGVDSLVREHSPNLYDRSIRYMLTLAVYAGWIAGVVMEISDATLALWYSFLAGGMIVVATVYELPHIRSHRQYTSFLGGAGIFSALVLAIDYFG